MADGRFSGPGGVGGTVSPELGRWSATNEMTQGYLFRRLRRITVKFLPHFEGYIWSFRDAIIYRVFRQHAGAHSSELLRIY